MYLEISETKDFTRCFGIEMAPTWRHKLNFQIYFWGRRSCFCKNTLKNTL